MPVPDLKKLRSISPLIGEKPPRKGRVATLVRERLAVALSLKPYLWVPRVIHRTPLSDEGPNGNLRKVALSIHNGSIVGVQTLLNRPKPGNGASWIYTRFNAPFTRCSERIGLHQRLLRHLAAFGVETKDWKIIKRIFKVGFQVPIKHLRKMVRNVVLSCHEHCCKKDNSQPLGTALGRSHQYPSLTGETKSIRKYGIQVPLWDRSSGFTVRGRLALTASVVGV
jgi:hypothetical protein